MKKFKKLIPALCMLLVSAVLMGTSTYAWFSMNKTATVSGMQVSAKSDSIYLLISKDKTTAPEIQNENKAVVDLAMDDFKQLKPSALVTVATKDGVKNETLAVNKLGEAGSWYTAFAQDATNSTVDQNTEEKLDATLTEGGNKYTFTDFVLVNEFHFTLAKGSNDAKDLKVESVTFAPAATEEHNTIAAVRVLFVCGENAFIVKADGTVTDIKGATVDSKILAAEVTASEVVDVQMYVFYDGNDDTVYTNNVLNLVGASVEVKFNVDAK